MTKSTTDPRSFILKPSTLPNAGIGVFLLHDVLDGTHMELFLPDFEEELCDPADVPVELQGYCIGQEGGKILCPKHFNSLDIGNYLNHSKNANLRYEKGKGFFANRMITAGEELLANYIELGEPEEVWDSYYKKEESA